MRDPGRPAAPDAFAATPVGTRLGPLDVTVSPAANERYWRAGGVEHPLLAAGALYPPIAANLTILCFQQTCPHPMVQTAQRLRCHRRVDAGTPLRVTGRVSDRFEKRGLEYVEVEVVVATRAEPDAPVWTSTVDLTPAAGLEGRR